MSFLQQEDGNYLLQETGDNIILEFDFTINAPSFDLESMICVDSIDLTDFVCVDSLDLGSFICVDSYNLEGMIVRDDG